MRLSLPTHILATVLLLGPIIDLSAGSITPLTELSSLRPKAPEQAQVRVRATVTYFDPDWSFLFASDGDDATFVSFKRNKTPSSVTENLQVGDRVEIEGRVGEGRLAPVIHAQHITRLETLAAPAPRHFQRWPDDLTSIDGRYVSAPATVIHALTHRGRTRLHLQLGGQDFRMILPSTLPDQNPTALIGATVQVTGTAGLSFYNDAVKPSLTLFTQSQESIRVLTPPPLPPAPPLATSAGTLRTPNRSSPYPAGDPVLLTGTVVLVEDSTALWVGNSERSIRVNNPYGNYGLNPGVLVTISGRMVAAGARPAVEAITMTPHGFSSPPTPRRMTVSELVERHDLAGALVQVEAQVQSLAEPAPGALRVKLANERQQTVALLPFGRDQLSGQAVAPGATLSLRGIKRPAPGGGAELYVPNAQHLNVIAAAPSPGQPTIVLWPILVVLGIALLTVGWGTSLRRQVSRHTAELRQNTDRLARSEAALAATTARLRAVHDAVREAILVTAPDGKLLDANVHFTSFFALPVPPDGTVTGVELAQQLSSTVSDPHAFSELWQDVCAAPNTQRQVSLTSIHPSGHDKELETFTAPVYLDGGKEPVARVWVFRDVTGQRDLEQRLVEAEKMQAVGRLAGGIAHDFNNLLTGISGSISIARLAPTTQVSEIEPHLDNAAGAADRATDLVHRLLGFSRQSTLELVPANANATVSQAIDSFRTSLPDEITMVSDLEPELWFARLDSSHLAQVITALLTNASDALPAGGAIRVTTQNRKRLRRDQASSQLDCIEIRIADDGIGIHRQHLPRVFEPFFTTKEQGKGTGLGLAMASGVIEQHGGWITCNSKAGQGTTLCLYLPKHAPTSLSPAGEGSRSSRHPHAAKASATKSAPRNRRHVLIVDDEPVVRAVSEGIFRHNGYQVSIATNGREAVDWVRDNPDAADVVVLDLTMPVMSGKEALREIRSLCPELPVVVASGYLVDLDAFAEEVGSRPDAFVQKPFDVAHMIEVVGNLLAGKVERV